MALHLMLTGKAFSQTCTSCTTVYATRADDDITVNKGDTVCILSGVVCRGAVWMNGGTLCNSGIINNLILSDGAGVINNSGAIYNTETSVTLSDDLTISNAPGSLLTFSYSVYFDMDESLSITLKQYNSAKIIFQGELNINTGNLIINNGMVWSNDTTIISPAYFNLVSGNFNSTVLSITNTATGIINSSNSFNLNDPKSSYLKNKGIINIYDAFNVGGRSPELNMTNNKAIYTGGDFKVAGDYGYFILNNTGGRASTTILSIENFSLSMINATVSIDSSQIEVNNNLHLHDGIINNNGLLAINGNLYNYGQENNSIINNTKTLTAKNIFNKHRSGFITYGIINNYKIIQLSDSLSNQGKLSLNEGSWLITNHYLNTGSGTVQCIESKPADLSAYPQLFISGNSENNTYMKGFLIAHDISLLVTDANTDQGFDVINNPELISDNIYYVTQSNGNARGITGHCSLMPSVTFTAYISDKDHVFCAYGGGTMQLHSGFFFNVNGPHPVLSNVTYSWQPGTITGQNPVVPTPSVTTVYTVTADYGGCVFTQTVQVTVGGGPVPIIQYTSTPPYFSSSTATFNVTQSGPAGWVYSIAPTSASVSINASTGQITAYGNSFGQYTVSYCPTTAPNSTCGLTCAVTTVQLRDLACPFDKDHNNNTNLSLCPGDKIQLFASGGVAGSYSWAPAPVTPTAGLSCTACASPTLTFDGTAAQYTLTSFREGLQCGSITFSVHLKEPCQKEEIVGCCFGNYGAAVWLNSNTTYLNIYCNLLNELSSGTATLSPASLNHGEFQNENGTVRVLLDWIQNAKNTLYIPSSSTATPHEGITTVFGADQNIKGNSSTEFNELRLEGSGTKTIWINEYGYSTLNLNDKTLSLQNFVYAMKNPGSQVVRSSGYVCNGSSGYFSWLMKNATQLFNQKYLFPLGAKTTSISPFRYRPLVMANNSTGHDDEISANFMNVAPSFSNDAAFVNAGTTPSLINLQAPNVLQVNNLYYHKIKPSVPSGSGSDLAIRSYYLPNEGQFQSLSEWEKDPAQTLSWWGSTPGSSASAVTSTDAATYGLLYAMSSGSFSFNHQPFSLARGGFYLNTNSFGNGNSGTSISLASTPLPGNITPVGGGLNAFFGTGSSSGNSGSGGNTIFTPNPVAGEYVININSPNSCQVNGKIKFVIDQGGNIASSDIEYGNTGAPAYLGELSAAVYTIDTQNTGITLSSTPASLLKKCVNTVTVNTSISHDFILDQPLECINVYLPAAASGNVITYGTFKLYSASALAYASPSALSNGTNTVCLTPTLSPGAYRFELPVTASGIPVITEIIKGQLIIK